MTAENYIESFMQQLQPNLPPYSVVIVDNAIYYIEQKDKAQQKQTETTQ